MIYPDESDFGSDTANGITVRAYFAAMAMQGLLAGGSNSDDENIARYAVVVADALIVQLNMKPGAKS